MLKNSVLIVLITRIEVQSQLPLESDGFIQLNQQKLLILLLKKCHSKHNSSFCALRNSFFFFTFITSSVTPIKRKAAIFKFSAPVVIETICAIIARYDAILDQSECAHLFKSV